MPELDEATAKRLRQLHIQDKLAAAEERMKGGWYAPGPYRCQNCGTGIRKPRLLKLDKGKLQPTLSWCKQECADAWVKKFRLPPERFEWLDAEGQLKGYYIPGTSKAPGRYVTLDEIEAARGGGSDG